MFLFKLKCLKLMFLEPIEFWYKFIFFLCKVDRNLYHFFVVLIFSVAAIVIY